MEEMGRARRKSGQNKGCVKKPYGNHYLETQLKNAVGEDRRLLLM